MEELAGLVILLLIAVIVGGVCAAIANAKGRHVWGWFFIGLGGGFFGMFACVFWVPILVVAVLPNLNEQRERDAYAERENRRLREQLRQERMKSEAFRQHTQTRLDMHDNHLGLDTRSANAALPSNADRGGLLESQPGGAEESLWYYELNGDSIGPTSLTMIGRMLQSGQLRPSTLVWAEHLGDWTAAGDVPQLAEHLGPPRDDWSRP